MLALHSLHIACQHFTTNVTTNCDSYADLFTNYSPDTFNQEAHSHDM